MNSQTRPQADTQVAWVGMALVTLLGAVVRFGIVLHYARTRSADWFFSQSTELVCLAKSIGAGQGLASPFGGHTGPSAFLAPGYPALVAAVFAVFGTETHRAATVLMLLQAGFAVATLPVLMLLAKRLCDTRTALLAGTIWALSPANIFMPAFFWESSLSILLLTLVLLLLLRAAEQQMPSRWALAGTVLAVAIAVNPALLLASLGAGVVAAWHVRGRMRLAPLAGLACLVLLSAPWVVRNIVALHAFIPLRSNFGYELWQGNRAGSDGFFDPRLHPNHNAVAFARYQSLGEVRYMQQKSAVARADIAAVPGRFARLTGMRILSFWTGVSHRPSPLIVAAVLFTSIGAFVGLALLWVRSRPLAWFLLMPIVLFPVPYYITHPDFRFRLLLDPVLSILTAYALVRVLNRAMRQHTSRETRAENSVAVCESAHV